jgi:hypothetical protein
VVLVVLLVLLVLPLVLSLLLHVVQCVILEYISLSRKSMKTLLDLHEADIPGAYLISADGNRIAEQMNSPRQKLAFGWSNGAGPGIPHDDCPGLERISN